MTAFIIRRLIQSLFVMILASMMVFTIMRMLPGDPILLYVSQEDFANLISKEEIQALREEFGLNKSVPMQYLDWINGVAHGDFGQSIFFRTTVVEEIKSALPVTFHLGGIAFILAHLIGIPIGVICAARRGQLTDTVLTVLANVGITAPIFWFGILLVYLFGLYLGWLPIQGYTSPFENFSLSLQQSIMPIFCLTLFPLSATVRQTRSAMLEIIRQDYIRTAWAKGLSEPIVILKHAVKNGIIPVVTLAGMSIPHILGGQVLIEKVFNIPGMGRLAVEALFSHDYAIVQGIILIISFVVVLANLIVDISYGWLDPRVRYE